MDKPLYAAANTRPVTTEQPYRLYVPRIAWAPLAIFLAAEIGLWFRNVQTPSEAPSVLVALSLVLTVAPWLGVAFLLLRSFFATGASSALLFGCGAALWSASGLSPFTLYLVPEGQSANTMVSVHNLIVWAASLCFLAGAALLHRGRPALERRWLALLAAYCLTLAAAALIALSVLEGWTPVFFIQSEGATLERQFVLASTIIAILLTCSLLQRRMTSRSPFLDWLVLALLLLAIGYAGLMLQTTVGGVLGWVSRGAQLFGGIYMLVAAYATFVNPKPAVVVLAPSEERAPHRYSLAIAVVLVAAVVHLVFLHAFGVRFTFITFYPAVALAAIYGGLRAAVLATFLAALIADYFWIEPVGTFAVSNPVDGLALAIFVLSCLLISWIVERMQNARTRLQELEVERRSELERMVAERNAALELAHEASTRSLAAATATEAELQAVLDAVPAGIWIARDLSYGTVQANRLATALMRIPEGANASKSGPSLLHFDIFDKDGMPVPNEQLPLRRAAGGEEVSGYEFEWRFSDGDSSFLHGNATPLRDTDGNIAGGVAAFIDVTERKRAESALQENTERLAAVLEAQQEIASSNQGYAALLQTILERMSRLAGADGSSLEIVDGDDLVYEAATGMAAGFVGLRVKIGASLSGQSMIRNKILCADDTENDPRVDREACRRIGLHSMIVIPLRYDERSFGVLKLMSARAGAFAPGADQTLRLMQEFLGVTIARQRAEAALRASEERLRFVADRAQVGHWHWEIAIDRLEWSPLSKQLLGIDQEEPGTYARFLTALHPDDRERTDRAVRACLESRGHRDFDIEYRTRRPDGTLRWLHAKGNAVFKDGKPVRMAGIVIDISERKQAEEALRESDERERLKRQELEAILEAIPAAVFISKDPACAQMSVNRAGHELLRLPADANASKSAPEGEAPHHFEVQSKGRTLTASELPLQRAAATKRAIEGAEFELYFADGDYKHFLGNALPLFGDREEVRGAVGAFIDITARKQAETALRESEERFRGIFENAGNGIAITTLQGRFHSCNPAFSAMLGYAEEELLRLDFQDLVHPEDREENVAAGVRLRAGEISSFQLLNRYIRKDGSTVWVHKRISLLRDAAGKPTHHIALVTDMTERKRYEEQINLLMREVNHRAKNMLALVQAIARQTVAASPQDFVERFSERVRALAASQDLLVKSEWKGVQLHDLVRSQLAHFSDLIGRRIDLRGPPLIISASAAQTIGMALHELATNAGKYGALSTPCGRVGVAWSLEDAGGGQASFAMSWRESGGPPVSKPARSGFGATVIVRTATMSLDADVVLDYAPGGLLWSCKCPAGRVLK